MGIIPDFDTDKVTVVESEMSGTMSGNVSGYADGTKFKQHLGGMIPKRYGWTMQRSKELKVSRYFQMGSQRAGATPHTEGKVVRDRNTHSEKTVDSQAGI